MTEVNEAAPSCSTRECSENQPAPKASDLKTELVRDSELLRQLSRYWEGADPEALCQVLEASGGLVHFDELADHADPFAERLARILALARLLTTRSMRYELGKEGNVLDQPELAAEYLLCRYGRPGQEVMGAAFLDRKSRLISDRVFFTGAYARASVCPQPIFKAALLCGAQRILLFHTHSSGSTEPSAEDREVTRKFARLAKEMGMDLVDHFVLGSFGRWKSLHRLGLLGGI